MTSILHRDPPVQASVPRGIVVAGATGGIGAALCDVLSVRSPDATIARLARHPERLPALAVETCDIACEITDEPSIRDAVAALPGDLPIDWVLVATGWLHGQGRVPEKTYRSLDPEHLLHAYRVNAVGPAMLLKHLIARIDLVRPCRIGVLSARVGSVSDNRLGGWHAYRASKAALNMLIRNYAIELARKSDQIVIAGLQPGTTDTSLSAPFQRNVPAHQLQTPLLTAEHLVDVVARLRAEDSGGLFDFLGVPFEP